jgi:outer membrane receptor protein involved in Fe transport
VTDAVVRITLPDRRFMRVNRNELESAGVELFGSWRTGPLAFAGNLTAQNVDLTDTEARETHEPENLPEVFGSADVRFHGAHGFFGGVGCAFTGSQYAIDVATGGYVGREWPAAFPGGAFSSVEARIAVDNLADEVHYDQYGLPEPGRRVRLELRLY